MFGYPFSEGTFPNIWLPTTLCCLFPPSSNPPWNIQHLHSRSPKAPTTLRPSYCSMALFLTCLFTLPQSPCSCLLLCVCADLQTPLKSHTALWRWSFISLVMEHLSWSFSTSGSSALPKAGLLPCHAQVKPGTSSTTKGPLDHSTASVATPHLEKLINNIKVSTPPVLQRKHQYRLQWCPRRLESGRRAGAPAGRG